MDDIRTPTLAQVVDRAIQSALKGTFVSLPAEIRDYDSVMQTASVHPSLQLEITAPDGTVSSKSRPTLYHVPILFPGGGGFRIMWPLSAGDSVTLIISDRSLDIWKSAGGDIDPLDERMHALVDAVAVPGLHPDSKAWNADDTSVITIGKDGAAADFVALSSKVTAQLNALATAINGWTPVPNDGGAALKVALSTLFTGPPVWPGSVASGSLKVLG